MRRIAEIAGYSIKEFIRNNCMHWAASLSFYTFFSLIPILFLMVSIIGFILGSEKELLDRVISIVKDTIPYLSDSIISNLNSLIENRKFYSWFSVFAIVWCAEFVLRAIKDALTPIFGIADKRGFIQSVMLSWGVFLVATMAVVFSIAITIIVELLEKKIVPILGVEISIFIIQSITIKYLIPFLIMTIATSIVLKMFAGRRIMFQEALWGSAVFALLWELAKNIFAWYVTNMVNYKRIYGSLGALMILLIWIFYSFNIFLFGAEISHAISIKRRNLHKDIDRG